MVDGYVRQDMVTAPSLIALSFVRLAEELQRWLPWLPLNLNLTTAKKCNIFTYTLHRE